MKSSIVDLFEAVADQVRISFCTHMGYEDYDGFWIGESAKVCNVNDEFRGVENMYEVLKYNMDPEIVRERYNQTAEEKYDGSLYGFRYNHQGKTDQNTAKKLPKIH